MISPILLLASANAMLGLEHARHWGMGGVGFIHHVGYRSHFDNEVGRSSWPVPAGESCEELLRFAQSRQLLSTEMPTPGEIFLRWSGFGRRFTHAGIVAYVESEGRYSSGRRYYECVTIAAQRRSQGIARGACQTVYKICPDEGDRFIRWVDLDGRREISDPLALSQLCLPRMQKLRVA